MDVKDVSLSLTRLSRTALPLLWQVNVVEVDGVHRSLPHVRHTVEETRGTDKMAVLQSVLERHALRGYRTLVFCNTVQSARAVEYALTGGEGGAAAEGDRALAKSSQAGGAAGGSALRTSANNAGGLGLGLGLGASVLSYHGDLNSKVRHQTPPRGHRHTQPCSLARLPLNPPAHDTDPSLTHRTPPCFLACHHLSLPPLFDIRLSWGLLWCAGACRQPGRVPRRPGAVPGVHRHRRPRTGHPR